MRDILRFIGLVVGLFIGYVILCMIWGLVHRQFQKSNHNKVTTLEEEMEFGRKVFDIFIIILIADFLILYFTGMPNALLLQGISWQQRMLEYTLVIPFGGLTIWGIFIAIAKDAE